MTADTLNTRLPICLFKEVSEKYLKARDLRKIYTMRHTGRKKKNSNVNGMVEILEKHQQEL